MTSYTLFRPESVGASKSGPLLKVSSVCRDVGGGGNVEVVGVRPGQRPGKSVIVVTIVVVRLFQGRRPQRRCSTHVRMGCRPCSRSASATGSGCREPRAEGPPVTPTLCAGVFWVRSTPAFRSRSKTLMLTAMLSIDGSPVVRRVCGRNHDFVHPVSGRSPSGAPRSPGLSRA